MITTVVTFAFVGFTVFGLVSLVRHDADKIGAALMGDSWLSRNREIIRPVTIRYKPLPAMTTQSARQPALRAVA